MSNRRIVFLYLRLLHWSSVASTAFFLVATLRWSCTRVNVDAIAAIVKEFLSLLLSVAVFDNRVTIKLQLVPFSSSAPPLFSIFKTLKKALQLPRAFSAIHFCHCMPLQSHKNQFIANACCNWFIFHFTPLTTHYIFRNFLSIWVHFWRLLPFNMEKIWKSFERTHKHKHKH